MSSGPFRRERPWSVWPRSALILACALLLLAGCASPSRLPAAPNQVAARAVPWVGPIRFLVARDLGPMAQEARDALARERAWRAASGQGGPLPPVAFLAISGGGDDGAFAAGLLNGWTASGTRPEFKVVTGVSTGALIAPFAFLGSSYDATLKAAYTNVSDRDIFRSRGLVRGVFADALLDTKPLKQFVQREVTPALLDQIAAEYAKGRLLLVGTTNLDTLEPVVWNMTAIAASRDPNALELFRKILIASSAVPAAFPPEMIEVQVDGQHYQEMHVDGGAMAQVFVYPPGLRLGEEAAAAGAERKRTLYIIRNSRLDGRWATVRRRTLSIAGRAIDSLIQTQGIGDLYRIYLTCQRDGVGYNLAFIPASFDTPHPKPFDTAYMRSLYQTGYDMAARGYPWQNTPPGYGETPLRASAAK